MKQTKNSNTVAVVVGMGCNAVEIPLLVYPSMEIAHKEISKLGLPKRSDSRYDLPEEKMNNYDEEKDEHFENPLLSALFKKHPKSNEPKYYDGCGGCYALEIREVTFGIPFIGWDLD